MQPSINLTKKKFKKIVEAKLHSIWIEISFLHPDLKEYSDLQYKLYFNSDCKTKKVIALNSDQAEVNYLNLLNMLQKDCTVVKDYKNILNIYDNREVYFQDINSINISLDLYLFLKSSLLLPDGCKVYV